MPRTKTKFKDPKRQKAHEQALARRRARHAEKRMAAMASEAAEGQADFESLVDAERQRIDRQRASATKAASTSPKTITAARENLTLAFDLMGGVPALVVWGRANPTEFYRIWARLIPKEAAEPTQALPLEMLLSKLASKEEKTVATAAWEIGMEVLEEAGRAVTAEDLASLGTIQ